MLFGIDQLLSEPALRRPLAGKKLALVGHPASVTARGEHALDALMRCADLDIVAAFGPQHGMKGDKQDNMVESDDYLDPVHGIPVYSLYGTTRRPTPAMLAGIDAVLFDLQALGCRIYTYITTLRYFLDACQERGIALWILDRPTPPGRLVDGLTLRPGEESFVGCAQIPMAYGLSNGEFARWLVAAAGYSVELHVIPVADYHPTAAPGYGWPVLDRPWINPSPNAASLNMARCFPGTVLIEGTTLSEGRGTTTPLEVIGAPGLDMHAILARMAELAPQWLQGAHLRHCFFQPVFHKYTGMLCEGVQIHAEAPHYDPSRFAPFRLVALLLKALRQLRPDYDLWRTHEYEYEVGRLAIDVINGGPLLRTWVDDPTATAADLDALVRQDLARWREQSQVHLIYR